MVARLLVKMSQRTIWGFFVKFLATTDKLKDELVYGCPVFGHQNEFDGIPRFKKYWDAVNLIHIIFII